MRIMHARHSRFSARTLTYTPVWLALRPLDSKIALIAPEQLSVTSAETQSSASVICTIKPKGPRGPALVVWVDPSKDFVPTIYEMGVAGQKPILRIELDYQKDQVHGWIVSKWHTSYNDSSDHLLYTIRGSVSNYLLNPSFSEADFAINFPPDAAVMDLISNPTQEYLLRADGTKRPILPEERGISFSKLAKSAPGYSDRADLDQGNRTTRWIMAILLTLTCILSGILVLRRIRREQ